MLNVRRVDDQRVNDEDVPCLVEGAHHGADESLRPVHGCGSRVRGAAVEGPEKDRGPESEEQPRRAVRLKEAATPVRARTVAEERRYLEEGCVEARIVRPGRVRAESQIERRGKTE